MAKPVTTPAVRLRNLASALVKAKALKRGELLSAKPMAELLSVSWPALRDWCNEIPGFDKHFTSGGLGTEYRFKALSAVKFLIRHFEAEQKKNQTEARRVRKVISGASLDQAPPDMGLDEIGRAIKIAAAIREERRKQGELIEVATAGQAIEDMIGEMQQAAIQAGREQDPTGQWPAEYSEKWQHAIDNVALATAGAGERCLSRLRGGTA